MKFSILFILILSALVLYAWKYITEQYHKGVLLEKIEKAAKKALRSTCIGMVVLGFLLGALFAFPVVRNLCFIFLPARTISVIYRFIAFVFETTSVYAVGQLVVGMLVVVIQCGFFLSILGLFIIKSLLLPHMLSSENESVEEKVHMVKEVSLPYAFGKIFLNFANLRI